MGLVTTGETVVCEDGKRMETVVRESGNMTLTTTTTWDDDACETYE